jgi:hypothetical protein
MMPASEFWAGVPELAHLFAKPKKQPQPIVMREVVEGGCVVLRLNFSAGRKSKSTRRKGLATSPQREEGRGEG